MARYGLSRSFLWLVQLRISVTITVMGCLAPRVGHDGGSNFVGCNQLSCCHYNLRPNIHFQPVCATFNNDAARLGWGRDWDGNGSGLGGVGPRNEVVTGGGEIESIRNGWGGKVEGCVNNSKKKADHY